MFYTKDEAFFSHCLSQGAVDERALLIISFQNIGFSTVVQALTKTRPFHIYH